MPAWARRVLRCRLAPEMERSWRSRTAMRSRTLRRSTSSFISPGPRPPMPPMSRDMAVPFPARRGRRYLSWASSTWTFPSRLWARRAKMSRMSWVRSMTLSSVASAILFCCDGDRS